MSPEGASGWLRRQRRSFGDNQNSSTISWLACLIGVASFWLTLVSPVAGLPVGARPPTTVKRFAPDFPAFAITLLGSANQQQQQQQQQAEQQTAGLQGTSNSDSTRMAEDEFDEFERNLVGTNNDEKLSSLASSSGDDEEDEGAEQIGTDGGGGDNGDEKLSSATSNNVQNSPPPSSSAAPTNSANTTAAATATPNYINNNKSKVNLADLMKFIGRKYVQQTPNKPSFQICDLKDPEFKCNDENAVCEMAIGTCVCKPDYFLIGQSSLCKSIEWLLNDCKDDFQCKAFNVDLVCDTESNDRPICDCAEGYYFEQESQTCLPCYRSSANSNSKANDNRKVEFLSALGDDLIASRPTSNDSSRDQQVRNDNNATLVSDTISSANKFTSSLNSTNANFTATANATSTNVKTTSETTTTTTESNTTTAATPTTSTNTIPLVPLTTRGRSFRSCRPIDYDRMESRGRHHPFGATRFGGPNIFERKVAAIGASASDYEPKTADEGAPAGAAGSSGHNAHNGGARTPMRSQKSYSYAGSPSVASSSDPFRIKTPLEVFMGAIMLFTLFTVAWFFLQRMIHDCRAILRSIRNPEFASNCTDQNFTGPLTTRSGVNHHYFDPTGQAVARLLASDAYNPNHFAGLTSSLYQRDLAGVMVQHLAANLSPSSTNQALSATAAAAAAAAAAATAAAANVSANNETSGGEPTGARPTIVPFLGGTHSEQEAAALYSSLTNGNPARTAAAAAAAQILLSPSHPAVAILRAAAASAAQHSAGADYSTASLLSSMFDPPPKYEEAMAETSINTTTTTTASTTATTQLNGYTNATSLITITSSSDQQQNQTHQQQEPQQQQQQQQAQNQTQPAQQTRQNHSDSSGATEL